MNRTSTILTSAQSTLAVFIATLGGVIAISSDLVAGAAMIAVAAILLLHAIAFWLMTIAMVLDKRDDTR